MEQARLVAVGLVDSPAYAGSIVQVRGQALAEALEHGYRGARSCGNYRGDGGGSRYPGCNS